MSAVLVQTIGVMRRRKGPSVMGELYQDGYFAGYVTVSSIRYAILLSPKAGETNQYTYKSTRSRSPDPCFSTNDGYAATNAMIADGTHGVATWAQSKRSSMMNGQNDWYVPALQELETVKSNLGYNTNFQSDANALVSGVRYWTATSHGSLDVNAYQVYNSSLASTYAVKDATGYYTRLVRRTPA